METTIKVLKIVYTVGMILFLIGCLILVYALFISRSGVCFFIAQTLVLFSLIFILPYGFIKWIFRTPTQFIWEWIFKWEQLTVKPLMRLVTGGIATFIYLLIVIVVPIARQTPSLVTRMMDVPLLLTGNYLSLEGVPERSLPGHILINEIEIKVSFGEFRSTQKDNIYQFIIAPNSMALLDIIDERGESLRIGFR